MDLRAAIRVRRTGAISWRQALTVLCGLAVVTAMIAVAEIAQRSAQRHQHVQVLVLRVGTASQQIATLAWQGIAQTQAPGREVDPTVIRHGLAIWGEVSAAFTAMRAADSSPSTVALMRDVNALYREGVALMALAQRRDGSTTLPSSFQGVLARLDADARTAAAVQQQVTDQAFSRAQIAELASLAFGLLLLALLGLRLHRLRRAAGLTEAERALERRSEQRIRALVGTPATSSPWSAATSSCAGNRRRSSASWATRLRTCSAARSAGSSIPRICSSLRATSRRLSSRRRARSPPASAPLRATGDISRRSSRTASPIPSCRA